jgi:hypothetical protein
MSDTAGLRSPHYDLLPVTSGKIKLNYDILRRELSQKFNLHKKSDCNEFEISITYLTLYSF